MLNYYRRYVGDYLRDTSRLSMLEHGAYTLLLDYYYADEKPLPSDEDEIYLMVRAMTPADRKAVNKVLGRYFTLESDGYHQKRADHEIEVSKKARSNGKTGGRPRTEPETGSITGIQTGSKTETVTEHETETTTVDGGGSGHPPTTNHQPPSNQPPANSQGLATLTPEPVVDCLSLQNQTPPSKKTRAIRARVAKPEPPTNATWSAYAEAYRSRYGVDPVRNAKVNGVLANLVQRLGTEASPHVARHYVWHNRSLYVGAKHPVDLLLRDAEGLHTEWASGRTVTDTQARQMDRKQNHLSIADQLKAEARIIHGK